MFELHNTGRQIRSLAVIVALLGYYSLL